MGLSKIALLKDIGAELETQIQPWLDKYICALDHQHQAHFDRQLLMGILMKLTEMSRSASFGSNYFRITPVSLTAGGAAQRLVSRETQDLVRKVSVWIDAASGGPTPTIRISTGSSGTGGGGIRVNAGQVNELGEVPSNQELWVSSTATINLYVIERA